MITLYVLRSLDNGKHYVGITSSLSRRIEEHRRKGSKGGQILGRFVLLHTEKFSDYSAAREREKILKSGCGREWLKKLRPSHELPV